MTQLDEKWLASCEKEELQVVKEIYYSLYRSTLSLSRDQFNLEGLSKKGNTVLHRLTKTIGTNPDEKDICLKMFDGFLSLSVHWWRRTRPLDCNITDEHARYLAVKRLTLEIPDKTKLSVLEVAFNSGAVEVIRKLMMMENVNTCVDEKKRRYDISHMTPKTSGQDFFRCSTGRRPCLNLLRNSNMASAVEVLDIEPLKEIESFYTSVTSKIYCIMALIHILYMTLFSYCCCDLLRDVNGNRTFDPNATLTPTAAMLYFVVPIEPSLLTVYVLCNLCSVASWKHFYFDLIRILLTVFYIVIVGVSVYLYHINNPMVYYTMSLSLLLGWLVTFSFTRGIRSINFFMKVIMQIILADVLKVLFVYVFFLLGFSFAIHVQFLSSQRLLEFYKTPAHTMFLMFNVMMGMGEQLLDVEIESELQAAGMATVYSKILYTMYVIFMPIVLLNLLIAMMNTSYALILEEHALIWRIDSILLGVAFEQNVPCIAKLCGRETIHYGYMFPDTNHLSKHIKNKVWFIEVKDNNDQLESNPELEVAEDTQSEAMDILADRLHAVERQLTRIEDVLELIREKLNV